MKILETYYLKKQRKQKAKQYLVEGIDPPANTAEQAIWKDAVTTAKKNKDGKGRFSFDSGYSKSMKGKDFYAGKIKIRDNQTGKTFSFNTFAVCLKERQYRSTHWVVN